MAPEYRTIPILQEGKTYWSVEKDFPYTPTMDQVRELIASKAKELGGLAEMSRSIGKNHAYLQQFVHRGVPASLPEDVRPLLAELMGVEENALRAVSAGRPLPGLRKPAQNARIGGAVQLGATIPAYGHARGGRDGQFVLNGNKVADILAPPSLAGVKNAFAVYVAGTSMEPRYHPGEAVFVNPGLPVRKDDYVVAEIATQEGEPPDAYVKRFISRDSKWLKLHQYKPSKNLKFPEEKVVSVYRIIMAGDG